jgi:hypothetical protein
MNTKTNSTKWSWIPQNERWATRTGILLLLLLTLPAVVQAQFTYTTNNGTVTITRYTGLGGVVTIPDMINGLPVTSIGNSAFRDFSDLTSVTIPRSVTNIESLAFYNCMSLASVNIPYGVTSIGEGTFYNCLSLTSVTIPTSVISIGQGAFDECSGLTSVAIPNSVTSIGHGAFSECSGLTNVTIGNSVAAIGGFAFGGCSGLTSVIIPNSVTNIEDWPFIWCSQLTAIRVDTLNSAYSSVDGVLFNKPQTTLVEYPEGIAAPSYTIPNSVTNIGNAAFAACTSLRPQTSPIEGRAQRAGGNATNPSGGHLPPRQLGADCRPLRFLSD